MSTLRISAWIVPVAVALAFAMVPSIPGTAQAAAVVRGPYLQTSTPTSVIVRWRTDATTTSRVRYGTAPGVYGNASVDTAMTTEHEIVVPGLAPGTTYYYAVGTTAIDLAGGDSTYHFRTHPLPGAQAPVRVWILGDAGTADSNAVNVRDAYASYAGSQSTDVWLTVGDNAYSDGTDAQFQSAVFDMYPEFLRNTVFWPAQGNHDKVHAPDPDYFSIFTLPQGGEAGGVPSGSEAYYSFDYANIHFVCLDTYGSTMNPWDPMLTWLVDDLAANTQEWTIAYWHHAPYSRGSHDSDVDWAMGKMRLNGLPILEAGGVDLVLGGHSHSYERSFLLQGHYGQSATLADSMKIDTGDGSPGGDGAYLMYPKGSGLKGTVYAVCGTSGWTGGGPLDHPVMVSSQNVLGSMMLDVSGDELIARFIDDAGAIRDSFVINKVSPTDVADIDVAETTVRSAPLLVSPNPFHTSTRIEFATIPGTPVDLTVYDIRGRVVRRLIDNAGGAGSRSVIWDGADNRGHAVSSGVYFLVLREPDRERLTRVQIVR